jgi:hypothetical protein
MQAPKNVQDGKTLRERVGISEPWEKSDKT